MSAGSCFARSANQPPAAPIWSHCRPYEIASIAVTSRSLNRAGIGMYPLSSKPFWPSDVATVRNVPECLRHFGIRVLRADDLIRGEHDRVRTALSRQIKRIASRTRSLPSPFTLTASIDLPTESTLSTTGSGPADVMILATESP